MAGNTKIYPGTQVKGVDWQISTELRRLYDYIYTLEQKIIKLEQQVPQRTVQSGVSGIPEVGVIGNPILTGQTGGLETYVTSGPAFKEVSGAPYTNDGFILINVGGTIFKIMTTA